MGKKRDRIERKLRDEISSLRISLENRQEIYNASSSSIRVYMMEGGFLVAMDDDHASHNPYSPPGPAKKPQPPVFCKTLEDVIQTMTKLMTKHKLGI